MIGYSSAADKVLRVILRPKSDARPGTWWGETAWVAGPRYRKLYEGGIDDD